MFGNLIKILLFAVIIASIALFTRERLQPSPPADAGQQTAVEPQAVPATPASPDTEKTAPVTATTPEEAAPPEAPETPVATPRPPTDGPVSAGPVGEISETGDHDAAVPPPQDRAERVAPDAIPSETPAPADAEETDQQEAPSAAMTLPPAHPGPDDTTLPPVDQAPVPPLTQ